jgi:hypothetical protein
MQIARYLRQRRQLGFSWQNRQRKKLMPVMAAGAYLHVTFNDVAPGSILATSQHYDQKSERAWRSSYGRQKNTPPPAPWHATPHPLRPSALIEAPDGTFQKQFETRVRWGRRPDRRNSESHHNTARFFGRDPAPRGVTPSFGSRRWVSWRSGWIA